MRRPATVGKSIIPLSGFGPTVTYFYETWLFPETCGDLPCCCPHCQNWLLLRGCHTSHHGHKILHQVMYVTCYVTFINYYWCFTTNLVFSVWQYLICMWFVCMWCIWHGDLPKSKCQYYSASFIHHWFYKQFNMPVIDKSIDSIGAVHLDR